MADMYGTSTLRSIRSTVSSVMQPSGHHRRPRQIPAPSAAPPPPPPVIFLPGIDESDSKVASKSGGSKKHNTSGGSNHNNNNHVSKRGSDLDDISSVMTAPSTGQQGRPGPGPGGGARDERSERAGASGESVTRTNAAGSHYVRVSDSDAKQRGGSWGRVKSTRSGPCDMDSARALGCGMGGRLGEGHVDGVAVAARRRLPRLQRLPVQRPWDHLQTHTHAHTHTHTHTHTRAQRGRRRSGIAASPPPSPSPPTHLPAPPAVPSGSGRGRAGPCGA